MNGSPEVTVVIPTRNRAAFLPAALSAAFLQEDVELEVVVFDDASTDQTPFVLAAVSDPRLRVIRSSERRGVARARNVGIMHARGKWIAFLDDDDVWSPRKLRTQLDEATAQQADFVYGAAVLVDERGTITRAFPAPPPDDLALRLLERCVIPAGSSNVAVKAELVRRLRGFDDALSHLDDWDLWVRLALAGRAAACPQILVACREHAGNRLLAEWHGLMAEFDYLVEKHRSTSLAQGLEFDRAEFARWVAGGHRRSRRRLHAADVYLRSALASRDVGNLLRGVFVLVGERAMKLGRRQPPAPLPADPPWLELYR
jgi:glycosyltransferase involved in cell wall biosynthesis